MKAIKRIAAGLLCAVAATTMCGVSVMAEPGEFNFEIVGTHVAPVQDGVITVEEYAGNAPIVISGTEFYSDGNWVGAWAGEKYSYYYTWDETYLYVGITVEGDVSPSQEGGDADWFRNGDMVQLGFNPGFELEGCHPIILGVGFTADKQPMVWGDAFRSTVDGEQTKAVSDAVKGFSKAYSADGINYSCEIAIPFHDYIFVNGVGRSGDGAPLYDLSAYDATEGLEIGLWYAMINDLDGFGGTSGDTCMRTDASNGCAWAAEGMSSVSITLIDAPVIETEAETVADVAPAGDAAQTFDVAVIAAIAAVVSAAGYAVSKKR